MFHYSTLVCVHSFGRKDGGPYYPQGPFCPRLPYMLYGAQARDHSIEQRHYSHRETLSRGDSRCLFKCTVWICVTSIGFPQTSADNSTNHKSGNIDETGKRAPAASFRV